MEYFLLKNSDSEEIVDDIEYVWNSISKLNYSVYFLIDENKKIISDCKEIIAYTDGSYHYKNTKDTFGSSVIVLKDNNIIYTSGKKYIKDNMIADSISAEVIAIIDAIIFGITEGYDKLTIRTDSQTSINSLQSDKKINHLWLASFNKFYKKAINFIDIKIEKVKAHSGNVWNDSADELAKKSNIKKIKFIPDIGFKRTNIFIPIELNIDDFFEEIKIGMFRYPNIQVELTYENIIISRGTDYIHISLSENTGLVLLTRSKGKWHDLWNIIGTCALNLNAQLVPIDHVKLKFDSNYNIENLKLDEGEFCYEYLKSFKNICFIKRYDNCLIFLGKIQSNIFYEFLSRTIECEDDNLFINNYLKFISVFYSTLQKPKVNSNKKIQSILRINKYIDNVWMNYFKIPFFAIVNIFLSNSLFLENRVKDIELFYKTAVRFLSILIRDKSEELADEFYKLNNIDKTKWLYGLNKTMSDLLTSFADKFSF